MIQASSVVHLQAISMADWLLLAAMLLLRILMVWPEVISCMPVIA
jgi:hypothetical protein